MFKRRRCRIYLCLYLLIAVAYTIVLIYESHLGISKILLDYWWIAVKLFVQFCMTLFIFLYGYLFFDSLMHINIWDISPRVATHVPIKLKLWCAYLLPVFNKSKDLTGMLWAWLYTCESIHFANWNYFCHLYILYRCFSDIFFISKRFADIDLRIIFCNCYLIAVCYAVWLILQFFSLE